MIPKRQKWYSDSKTTKTKGKVQAVLTFIKEEKNNLIWPAEDSDWGQPQSLDCFRIELGRYLGPKEKRNQIIGTDDDQ